MARVYGFDEIKHKVEINPPVKFTYLINDITDGITIHGGDLGDNNVTDWIVIDQYYETSSHSTTGVTHVLPQYNKVSEDDGYINIDVNPSGGTYVTVVLQKVKIANT